MTVRRRLGLDGPVAYTSLARFVSIVGSTGTVLLIAHFLSPIEQGYYYTLSSLVALQLVFELGFSFVIQQLAAHECAQLEVHADGSVSGDPVAHARLASTLQLSTRWYSVAALAMGIVLAPLGIVFFAHHSAGAAPVAWKGPWLAAVAGSMIGLWSGPCYSFMDGCGQIKAVAVMRLRMAVVSSMLAWSAMLLHHGLYAPALVILGQVGIGLLFLSGHRRFLLGLLRYPAGGASIRWTREVFPFQWRIAVSWICSYFTIQVFIPILFALRGAVEAGQMGMSLSITSYMTGLVLPWISTKATPFGRMIAERQFQELDQMFLRTLNQALIVFGAISLAACGMSALLPGVAPHLARRMVPPELFALLVLSAGANCVVQSMAILLRSFKSEPFLLQSLVVALLTITLAALTASRWGNAGVAFTNLVATAGIGFPIALSIYLRARRGYLAMNSLVMSGGAG